LEKGAGACGVMFRKFAGRKESVTQKQEVVIDDNVGQQTEPKSEAQEISPVQTVTVTNTNKSTSKKRKHDYYIAPKYQFPVGTPVPWGGINLEGGVIWGKGAFVGLDFGTGIFHGGGFRFEGGGGINIGNIIWTTNLQLVYGGSAGFWFMEDNAADPQMSKVSFGGPFVKLRWNFVELTYKGLFGFDFFDYPYYDRYEEISWIHRVMLGVHFATNKRER